MLHEDGDRYSDWIPGFVLLLGFLAMLGLQIAAESLHGDKAVETGNGGGEGEGGGEESSLLHSSAAPKPKPVSLRPSQQALYGLVVHSGVGDLLSVMNFPGLNLT